MNHSLLNFLETNSLLVEEQNAFHKNRSFSSVLKQNRLLLGCCVDFSSAFDFVNR